jgi:hypothetical protein
MPSTARFAGLIRDGNTLGARIDYSGSEGGDSTIVFYDAASLKSHISTLEGEGRDTEEEYVALSALITEARKA